MADVIKKRIIDKEFIKILESTPSSSKIWIAGLLVVIAIGIYAFVLQVIHGHEVTGMRDNVVWGVYIINFIFFVGISYSGAFISGILHFFDTPWKKCGIPDCRNCYGFVTYNWSYFHSIMYRSIG